MMMREIDPEGVLRELEEERKKQIHEINELEMAHPGIKEDYEALAALQGVKLPPTIHGISPGIKKRSMKKTIRRFKKHVHRKVRKNEKFIPLYQMEIMELNQIDKEILEVKEALGVLTPEDSADLAWFRGSPVICVLEKPGKKSLTDEVNKFAQDIWEFGCLDAGDWLDIWISDNPQERKANKLQAVESIEWDIKQETQKLIDLINTDLENLSQTEYDALRQHLGQDPKELKQELLHPSFGEHLYEGAKGFIMGTPLGLATLGQSPYQGFGNLGMVTPFDVAYNRIRDRKFLAPRLIGMVAGMAATFAVGSEMSALAQGGTVTSASQVGKGMRLPAIRQNTLPMLASEWDEFVKANSLLHFSSGIAASAPQAATSLSGTFVSSPLLFTRGWHLSTANLMKGLEYYGYALNTRDVYNLLSAASESRRIVESGREISRKSPLPPFPSTWDLFSERQVPVGIESVDECQIDRISIDGGPFLDFTQIRQMQKKAEALEIQERAERLSEILHPEPEPSPLFNLQNSLNQQNYGQGLNLSNGVQLQPFGTGDFGLDIVVEVEGVNEIPLDEKYLDRMLCEIFAEYSSQ